MTSRETAKNIYKDIIFAFQEAQKKTELQLFMPSFIRIGNEAFFYDDLYSENLE